MRRLLLALIVMLSWPAMAAAQVADTPETAVGRAAYAPFEHLMGKTWRGTGTGPDRAEDIQRWEWAVGGHAIRVVHSVNGGAYAGETLIFRDRDSGDYVFHYFTTGGFHTTGTMKVTGPGAFEVDEAVHGVDGLERIRSTLTTGADGVRRARSSIERDGQWVEAGGFDYREDASAAVVMPEVAQGPRETPVSAGPLALTRRIVRGVDEAGEDVAGYLRIRNGSSTTDDLVGARCTCADRVEFHRIRRDGANVSMTADEAWSIPGQGMLDVRPGSDLHLMLIGYDPARAAGGKVVLTLAFRHAGEVAVEFDLVDDSRGAWTAFD